MDIAKTFLTNVVNQVNQGKNIANKDVKPLIENTAEEASSETAQRILNPDNVKVRRNNFKQFTVQSLNKGDR